MSWLFGRSSLSGQLVVIPATVSWGGISLNPVSTFTAIDNIFDEGAAEIVDFDPRTKRMFIVNGAADEFDPPKPGGIDVVDISDINNPTFLFSIDISPYGSPNSVAVNPNWFRDEIAVAVEAPTKTDNGSVVFFDTDGNFIKQVEAGALPDMVTYDALGFRVLTANEGEPNDDYSIDPEGSITLIYNFFGAKYIRPWHVKQI
ncbi:MAG: hypothetical protein ACFB8W_19625, partial [Elainellaceae cyanobacterium]